MASLHKYWLSLSSLPHSEFDPLICDAVALSNCLIPKARELGMWEQLWRNRQGGGR